MTDEWRQKIVKPKATMPLSREALDALRASRDNSARDAAMMLQWFLAQKLVEEAALAYCTLQLFGIRMIHRPIHPVPANAMMVAPKSREQRELLDTVRARAAIIRNRDPDPDAVLFAVVSELRDKYEQLHAQQIQEKTDG